MEGRAGSGTRRKDEREENGREQREERIPRIQLCIFKDILYFELCVRVCWAIGVCALDCRCQERPEKVVRSLKDGGTQVGVSLLG